MAKKTESEIRKKILELYEENELANLESNRNRARSVTVGTAFGGAVELSMRGDYANLWVIMQPVEVVELIEQLAAGVGLQVAMRPRQDFASWRGWNVEADARYWAGSGQWQIEQATINHKQMLEEFREESAKLPPAKKKKTNNRKKATKKSKEIDSQKIKAEMEMQRKIADDLMGPALDHIEELREKAVEDRQEYLDFMNPPDVE